MTARENFPCRSSTSEPIFPAHSRTTARQRGFGQGRDRDGDPVQLAAADEGLDRARAELQIHDRPVADVGPAAGEPVGEVAVPLEVVAPRLAPEAPGDRAPLDHDGRDRLPLLLNRAISRAAFWRRAATGT